MTKEAIITRVRDELADNGVTYYSTDDMFDAYDDVYERIAIKTAILERMTTLTLTDDTTYYNLYNLISDYMRTFAIWDPVRKLWLKHWGQLFMRTVNTAWEIEIGPPKAFSVWDFQQISVYPHKLTVTDDDVYDVFYKAVPIKPLDLQSVPEMPEQYQEGIQFGMMSDLLAQGEDFTKAGIFFDKYRAKVGELRLYANTRSFPDRVNILREQFSGGSVYGE